MVKREDGRRERSQRKINNDQRKEGRKRKTENED